MKQARIHGRCPETGKAEFTSRKAAKDFIRWNHPGDTDIRAYHCDSCGYIHLGHLRGQDREWHREYHASRGA